MNPMSLSTQLRPRPAQLILLLAVLQAYCATFLLQREGFHRINSLLFFGAGIAITFLILKVPGIAYSPKPVLNRGRGLRFLGLALLLPVSVFVARKIMAGTPVSIEHADMLPIIQVQGNRFLDGNFTQIYDPIPEFWGGIQPIYLPAFWIPHVYATVLGFDIRWITFTGIWACVALCLWPGHARRIVTSVVLVFGLLMVLNWLHFEKTNNVIRLTEEGVVYFYYTLLAVAIMRGNPYFIGFCAALCFLSRYSAIGWFPFAIIYLLLQKKYDFLWRFCAAGAITAFFLLYPVGFKPLLVHLNLPDQYVSHAQNVWKQNPEYFQGLGMSKFFGAGGVSLNHALLKWGTFLVPLGFLFYVRRRRISHNMALLAGLQLSITFFYNFIDVPYLYLFYTPVFVSLAIGAWLHGYGTDRLAAEALPESAESPKSLHL
ncbi:hypothetical protein EPD60_01620 [Flaviaesturariibacter flavus]|uniref:Glycosyltransferase RgtA/B/C/D-like domain-containing protein n=1 Tax=Flaviaesturariibacter flavus TaxID=2502780 RepID=A0A4R1BNL4_9BACT|nr:hypothetical protein [Flaviaesturariibacter flavus]TCJ19139.1 hypothetical protein EPD60_01620 [Flaviaesturariibacter flavus]